MKMTTKHNYPKLYKKLKEFTLESCNLLSGYYKKEDYADKIEGIPFVKVSETEIQPLFFLEEPIIDRLFHERFQEIRDQKSFQNLQKYIEKEDLMYWNQAIDFLLFYFFLVKEFRFDEKTFDHLYNRLVKRKFKKEERDLVILPLQHFIADVDEIVLAGGIKIKRLSQKEVWKIKKHEDTYTATLNHQNTQFALTKIHSYKTPSPHDWDVPSGEELEKRDIIGQLHLVVTALRIYKEGDLMTPLSHFYVPLDYDRAPSGIGVSYPPILSTQNPYALTPTEVEDFQDFWKATIYEKGFPKKLEIAARRFDSLYERRNPEDNLIDCMIAFESIFGATERTRLMIAIKTAFLLNESKDEIINMYTFLKKVYDIRSAIVHGRTKKFPLKVGDEKYNKLQEVVTRTQELLRLTINQLLDGDIPERVKESFDIIELLEFNSGKEIIDRIFELQES